MLQIISGTCVSKSHVSDCQRDLLEVFFSALAMMWLSWDKPSH